MRTLPGVQVRLCVLGCPHGADKIEHYSRCPQVWSFLQKPRPHGLGLDIRFRTLSGFFMVQPGMHTNDKLAMSIAIYATSRTVAQAQGGASPLAIDKLMKLHATEALRGSRARKILAEHR